MKSMPIMHMYKNLYDLCATFYFFFKFSCCQEYTILNGPNTWNEANERCDLTNNTNGVSGAIPPGVSVWIGKRRDFTKWLAVEDCGIYSLDPNLQEITIKGQYPILECQVGCSKLYNSGSIRFGLKLEGSLKCVCNDRTQTSTFGTRMSKCNRAPVSCNQNNTSLPDLCGDDGGRLVVYNERPGAIFRGEGDCGTFKRNSVSSFSQLAQPCNNKHGYLQLLSQGQYNVIIPSNGVNWRTAAVDADIRQELKRFSSRDTVDAAWTGLSLQEWPGNISLWVGVLRASKPRQKTDHSPCETGLCYCAAVQLQPNGSIEEKLTDCSTKLPALCVSGSIRSTTSQISTRSTSTASTTTSRGTTVISTSSIGTTSISTQQTTSNGSMDNGQTFYPLLGVGIAILIVIVVTVLSLYILIRKRRLNGKVRRINMNEKNVNHRRPTEHSYVGSLVIGMDHNYQALNNSDSNRQSESPTVHSDSNHVYIEVIDDDRKVSMEMSYENSHTQLKEPH